MKVNIVITGQVSGNFTLLNKLNNGTQKSGMFNSFILNFDKKSEAIKAIKAAYKSLCNEEPENKGLISGIRKNEDSTILSYDASKAIILNVNN
jgi:hypothetical protein